MHSFSGLSLLIATVCIGSGSYLDCGFQQPGLTNMKPPSRKRLKYDNVSQTTNVISPEPGCSYTSASVHSRPTDKYVPLRVCTCCHCDVTFTNALRFIECDLDFDNEYVIQAFSHPAFGTSGDSYVCYACYTSLSQPEPLLPENSVAVTFGQLLIGTHGDNNGDTSFDINTDNNVRECGSCGAHMGTSVMSKFDPLDYNLDSCLVKKLLASDGFVPGKTYICKQCRTSFSRQNLVVCVLCLSSVKKVYGKVYKGFPEVFTCSIGANEKMWICRKCSALACPKVKCYSCDELFTTDKVTRPKVGKYDMTDDIVATTLAGFENGDYMCSRCDRNMMATIVCTCCHRKFTKYRTKQFDHCKFDFEDYIVSRALCDGARLCVGDVEYICQTCESKLRPDDNGFPKMPRNAYVHLIADPGSKFLRAIREKPEFVCTCCHRLLFRRAVLPFLSSKYDLSREIVRETLAERYRYPMHVKIYKGIRNAHIHPVDYDGVVGEYDELDECDEQDDDSVSMDGVATDLSDCVVGTKTFEYICKTCHGYLTRRIPKMPPQACANGLLLSDIPPELSDLTDLERRIIALRIPFMTIFCMVRYGSQYKVRGGCTNVPAALDQVVEMLPRMSTDVQYHPMRLKKKMAYKSSYMYNFVRKDKVMSAIRWLKDNNHLYRSVQLNDDWVNEWENGDLSAFIVDNDVNVHANDGSLDVHGYDDDHNSEIGSCVASCSDTGSDIVRNDDNGTEPNDVNVELERQELGEDRMAAERSLHTVGRPMANLLQAEDIENEVYTCAPGENMTPQYMLMDDDFEVLAFPDLFPYGERGYSLEGRKTKLNIRNYFQQRLLNVDGRFAHNIEYLFCAQYVTDIKHIRGETGLALRQKRGRTLNGRPVTAGMLRNPDSLSRLVREEHAYKFLRNVRGSPAYWQHELYDLLAMLRTFGIPTWFLTLSAADLHWVEMIEALSIRGDKPLTLHEIRKMPIKVRAEKLKSNPVTSVGMFQYRVESFFNEYLYQDFNPVGLVKEHAIKMEFQERGSPHAHCLLWVDGAPRVDVDSDDDVCAFVDRYVSGRIPDANNPGDKRMAKLVKQFETHSHSSYCRRKHSCRFGFPKAPSPKTIICRELPDDENKDELLQNSLDLLVKVHELIDSMASDPQLLSAVLDAAGVTEDEYVRALSICRKGKSIVLRRDPSDCFTNGSNHGILRLWFANIDFQYVFDEVTCIIYISAYMMKGERALGEVLKCVAKECMSDPIAEKLKKIGKAFMGKRVVGAPEAAMRELSMPLIRKSRKVEFVNSNARDERASIPKRSDILERMDDDDEDIYQTSLHDRYAARPDELEEMCLAKFGVTYTVNYPVRGSGTDNERDDNVVHDGCLDDYLDAADEHRLPDSIIHLKNDMGSMRKRKKDAVLRVAGFKQVTEPEKYYHSRLILYVPWRSENEFLDGFQTYKDKYTSVMAVVEHNARNFNTHQDELDEAINEIAENGPPERNWDAIAPLIEEENVLAANDDCVVVSMLNSDESDDDEIVNDLDVVPGSDFQCNDDELPKNSLSALYDREARKDIMSNQEYRKCMRGLNEGQRKIVMFNRKWCKDRIVAMRTGAQHPGFKVCLSGPGGTGKSHVIKMIRRDVIYLLQRTMKIDPGQPLVLLTAPTGLAAFNISGITLHSAFMLSVSKAPLNTSYEKKSTMQVRLANLATCIIDEISMVGRDTFEAAAEKVAQIKQTSERWGDVCILAVGDFYQLPPVAQCPVYAQRQTIRKPGDLAPSLWGDFVLHELTEVMRTSDHSFASALNSIREAQPAEWSAADIMFKSRELCVGPGHDDYPMDFMHVYARNDACAEWNNVRLNSLGGDLIVSTAIDVAKDKRTNLSGVSFSDTVKHTGNLVKDLKMKVGARVMLTMNVNTSDGLTNGAMGTISAIIGNHRNVVKVVIVRFDSPLIGQETILLSKYRHIDPKGVPVYHAQVTFTVHQISCRVSRSQFPLQLCWAVTIHKCQGMTLPGIVVDMTPSKGAYRGGQAYVALSRVRSLDTLHIVNYDRKQIRVASNVMSAMARMRARCLPDIPISPTLCGITVNDLVVVHLNIANLTSKLLDLRADHIFGYADVVCLNETHLSPDNLVTGETMGLQGSYEIFRNDRSGRGGGVLLAIRKCLAPMRVITATDVEHVAAQITFNGEICYVIAVYRPPTYPVQKWAKTLSSVVETYVGVKLCVVGDMNEDIDNNLSSCVSQMFMASSFIQHVSKPTRDSGTKIDHLYTRNISQASVSCDVIDCYYSDHDIVVCALSFD